jgi:purine-binding chemotaxis protein CheW
MLKDYPTPSTLLIFDFNGARFCLDAMQVRESVWLPELTPIEEAPPYIVGLFSMRGQIIPVTDLNLRFGHPARPHRLNDQIVILELNHLLMGLIVSEVIEVIEISAEDLQPPPRFEEVTHRQEHLVAGKVRVGDLIVTLLDAKQLMHQPQNLEEINTEQLSPPHQFCPQATPQEHAVYRARAKALMQVTGEEEGTRLALAVVELDGEYFGIELQSVQEFCDNVRPYPIPCCPPHILGAISLRGNLIVLLDLRAALNLPRATQSSGKTVVARLGEQAVGIAVDQVHDVIYLHEEELQAAPAALLEQHGAEIKGTAPYGGKMMVVLGLPALLAREEWLVNETV